MRKQTKTDRSRFIAVSTVFMTVALLIAIVPLFHVSAVQVEDRFVQLANPQPDETSQYRVGFTITDFSTDIGSIRIQFCQDSPIVGTPCSPPAGFDISGASIASQAGETGFSVHGDTDANNMILTRAPVLPTTAELLYEFDNVINQSLLGTFYARLFTYPTDDASGPHTQAGGVAMSTADEVGLETEVPPYLLFCSGVTITAQDCGTAEGFLIDFGEFSEVNTATATSVFVVATNAPSGFATRINGTTLTSGNNIIPALTTPTLPQTGASQFGINLRNNTNPNIGADPSGPGSATPTANYNQVNRFMFSSGAAIAHSNIPSSNRKFTVSYIANINGDQAPGIYTTTVSFVTLANF